MSLVAGVDVGNSTTEIVVADASTDPPTVVATERAPTRGHKGSAESGAAAAQLLRRVERLHALDVETVFVTPQRPVHTERLEIPEVPLDLGPIRALAVGSSTPAGFGMAVGRPVPVTADLAGVPRDEPIVLVSSDPLAYRATAAHVNDALAAGRQVVGLLLAGDEANLVAARVRGQLPIVDAVDAQECLACERIAVEVAAPGSHVRELADPIRLADALGLGGEAHHFAQAASSTTRGHRSAAIGIDRTAPLPGPRVDVGSVTFHDGRQVTVPEAGPALAGAAPGLVRSLQAPSRPPLHIEDLWLINLAQLADAPGVRAGSVRDRAVVAAALAADHARGAAIDVLTRESAGEVVSVATEATAARLGALTTPGADPNAWVLDLGGGTIDVIPPHRSAITAAGSGELLTACVRHALAISTGASEWVKRGPASRVDTPHVTSDESGERRFLTTPAPHGSVGWLVTEGPAGPLPFARDLPLAEWRAIRLALKQRVFAENLTRVLAAGDDHPREVLIAGGPAGDDELVGLLNATLGGAVVGRAHVAGELGHRWAVAYGLVLAGVSHLTALT